MKLLSKFLIFIFLSQQFSAQNNFVATNDIFGQRVFIENRGQFDATVQSAEMVKYAYESSNEHIYFTEKGLVYKLIKKFPLSQHQNEKLEHGKKVKSKSDEIHFVNMNWLGANANIQIVAEEKQSHYFSFGAAHLNSRTFKKITYKNVYHQIDIEYIIPEEKEYGIKYNVILHPGANPNDIKISYNGAVSRFTNKKGNIIISTPLEDITEHAPSSFKEDGEEVKTTFRLENNIISFAFPNGFESNKSLIIDPFVTTISLPSNNKGYDVDYDYFGNLFVFGGSHVPKLAKYNASGVLQWVFNGMVPSIPWDASGPYPRISNFGINKTNGSAYIGTGWKFTGTQIVRIDTLGNYDNFVSTPYSNWIETWDFGFHCPSNRMYVFGGGGSANNSGGILDQITGTVSIANFSGLNSTSQDVANNAIDDNGNIFLFYAAGAGTSNTLLKINNSFNGNSWHVPSTYYGFSEGNAKALYPVNSTNELSNGFNCLAVNTDYLYFYNGFNLAAYNKNTGAKIGFTTIPGQNLKWQGGIAVDDCNNLYIGGNGNILCYNFNGSSFTALPPISLGIGSPLQYVFDIKLDKLNKLLYVSGNGFAGVYPSGGSCGDIISLTSGCDAINSGSATITVTTSVLNPTITYIWTQGNTTISATTSTLTSNTVTNLPNGTYSVKVFVNSICHGVYINTLNIHCCPDDDVSKIVTQVNCTNTLNNVALSIVGGGTIVPMVIWSPAPASVSPNSLTASGLMTGTNTISIDFGSGCVITETVDMFAPPPPVTFSLNNLSNSDDISCVHPSIHLQANSNYAYGSLAYYWSSPTFTANTATVVVNEPSTITVTATDEATGCLQTHTITIGVNTVTPNNSVNPSNQVVTCNSGNPATFTGSAHDPVVNVQHNWYSPLNPLPGGVPIATSNAATSILSDQLAPGVYTMETTNLINGCKAIKTVTVTSLDAWPTFSVASSTNFSVGCSPLHQTTLSIVNPISTQTPPATCSYTFLPPGFGGSIPAGAMLDVNNTSTITQTPGTWTLVVQDNSNWCRTQISVPILQNTVAPNLVTHLLTQTLTCFHPTVLATGSSTSTNTYVNWIVPVIPPIISTPSIVIGPENGPNTSSTTLNYANYTVVATNSVNGCQTSSVLVINQNFRPPVSNPTISIGTPTAIYCISGTNPVVLTTGSSIGVGPPSFVANPTWAGPSPQLTLSGPSSYSCYVAGIYSLTVMDSYNGCKSTGTINVLDKTQPPVLLMPVSTASIDCGDNQAKLSIEIIEPSNELLYWFFDFPNGTAFSPTAAPMANGSNPMLSGTSASLINVSMTGMYQYLVTNTITGCQANGVFNVEKGDLRADFNADPISGYAPLIVNFTNNSSSSLGASDIISIWSFGNGSSQTTTGNIHPATSFQAAGVYTVILISSKGNCLDTTEKIIMVDMPSKLETPNVFTPNGDGSNDVFYLNTANLQILSAVIYDRWGTKVYEVSSKTGNISWDGKSLQGTECATGAYFYIISAEGKDGKSYETKGNISLFR
jgi:gliding motility-associated-like protein